MLRFLLKLICYLPFKLLFWTKWINKKELRKFRGKPVILAMNHRNALDGPVLVIDVWRKSNFWIKGELFTPGFGNNFFRALGGVPVKASAELSLMRESVAVLQKNRALCVMPEGHRSFNADDQLKIQNGIAMVALRSGVPIIPIVSDRPFRLFRLTRIKVGQAIDPTPYLVDGRMIKDGIAKLGDKLQYQMQQLLVGFSKPAKQKKWQIEPSIIGRGIVIRDGKLLVIHRRRDGQEYFVFPGGHVDTGETLTQTCAREVLEETSVVARPFRELYKFWYEDHKHGRGDGWQTFMACEYQSGEPQPTDAEEYTDPNRRGGFYEPMWLALDELEKVDLRPSFVKKQLLKDYRKKGERLPFPLRKLEAVKQK
ncbi:MAG: 1-acyl-sn-glycerol-3-phosphate acyltransferase [Clostridia bacterium]|nr:1-acyl-sn-glycerol-3-phosphate acyltransferase [Clostridia bacterium]